MNGRRGAIHLGLPLFYMGSGLFQGVADGCGVGGVCCGAASDAEVTGNFSVPSSHSLDTTVSTSCFCVINWACFFPGPVMIVCALLIITILLLRRFRVCMLALANGFTKITTQSALPTRVSSISLLMYTAGLSGVPQYSP